MKDVTVYYAPACAFSAGAVSFLLSRGADVRLVNLEQHPDEKERLERSLGSTKLETPTFVVDGEQHVAPPLSELKKLLAAWGLPDEAAPHTRLKESSDEGG